MFLNGGGGMGNWGRGGDDEEEEGRVGGGGEAIKGLWRTLHSAVSIVLLREALLYT